MTPAQSHGNGVYSCTKLAKQLTNIHIAGTDENLAQVRPIEFTQEQAQKFIDDDELVEVTPKNIRLRKKHQLEHERKKAGHKKDKTTD